MTPGFKVRVTKDHLVFSAGHFITITTPDGEFCERIHGHNWRAAVEVEGPLDENQYVFDFIALRDNLQSIVNRLDHRMLLPTRHPRIRVETEGAEVTARYEDRRWVFPAEECVLMPVEQTTAELIARWIGEELLGLLPDEAVSRLERIQIEVEENFGQWAICEIAPQDREQVGLIALPPVVAGLAAELFGSNAGLPRACDSLFRKRPCPMICAFLVFVCPLRRTKRAIKRRTLMTSDKLRRQIIFESARLMYSRQETEYYRAKMKAARKICGGWVKPAHLPSNAEIRDEIQRFASLYEGDSRLGNLQEMRLAALHMMRLLRRYKPRLIGSTLTGHVRRGSDIDIHIFPAGIESVTACLDEEGLDYHVEHKRVRKHGEERVFTHVHIRDQFTTELTCYRPDQASFVFKSSITGKAMERASIDDLEALIRNEYPDLDLDAALLAVEQQVDRFQIYRMLLIPLEQVEQSRKYHPEGDALYHSLQVFELARDEIPYDEEFQLASLLHDVGKAIDPKDHVAAGLQALDGFITERTAWLIGCHMEAQRILDGSIGSRAHRRLRSSPDYDELLMLARCDRDGRVPGGDAPELDEALDDLRELAHICG